MIAGFNSIEGGDFYFGEKRINNVDATVLAERPKLMPHLPAMREKLALAMQVSTDAVSLKATTVEGLGAIGRREGISAMAVATVVPAS
jgi:2-C-methyl-D-erythritol 2,4-cyclodiphosphate synthase